MSTHLKVKQAVFLVLSALVEWGLTPLGHDGCDGMHITLHQPHSTFKVTHLVPSRLYVFPHS